MRNRPQVVVIGAGFGGMQAARSLARSGADVLLIDRNNYNCFVPLLYQVACAQLEPGQIAYPIRTLFRRIPNVRFLQAEVQQVDLNQQTIKTDAGVISYHYLVLATGSQTQISGVSGVRHALPLRSLDDAVTIRNHLLTRFEQAVTEPAPITRKQLLTFVIVGGGATGVEVAGALIELIQCLLKRDYPTLKQQDIRVILLQSGDRLLPDLPPRLGHYTYHKLRRVGVDVQLGIRVTQVTPQAVYLDSGEAIASETVLWTAGLEAALPDLSGNIRTAYKGKLRTLPTLQLTDYREVYAIGDLALIQHKDGMLTGVAPEALQAGVAVARNINRQLQGRSPTPFKYFNKGRLAIIGCYSGVGRIAGIPFAGFLAWLLWLGVHLVYLPGFRNRLMVFLSWLQAYLLGDRPIRQILENHAFTRARQVASSRTPHS